MAAASLGSSSPRRQPRAALALAPASGSSLHGSLLCSALALASAFLAGQQPWLQPEPWRRLLLSLLLLGLLASGLPQQGLLSRLLLGLGSAFSWRGRQPWRRPFSAAAWLRRFLPSPQPCLGGGLGAALAATSPCSALALASAFSAAALAAASSLALAAAAFSASAAALASALAASAAAFSAALAASAAAFSCSALALASAFSAAALAAASSLALAAAAFSASAAALAARPWLWPRRQPSPQPWLASRRQPSLAAAWLRRLWRGFILLAAWALASA